MATERLHWAARPTAEMLPEAFKRIERWYKHLDTSGKLALWRRSLDEYYAGARTEGQIRVAGDQGELTTIKVNHTHNLGEHIVTAIAGQPPAFLPQAQSNDYESTSQTVMVGAILDSIVAQKGLDEVFTTTTRRAWVLTEGWAAPEWDENAGEPLAALDGQIARKGDVRVRTYAGPDVVRDYLKETGADHEWFILRRFENRHNVIARAKARAQGEEQAKAWEDAILAVPSKIDDQQNRPRLVDSTATGVDESDDIPVWEMRHAKTDAVPQGVRCVFVTPEVWLTEGPLTYRDAFVFVMRPEEELGKEDGYSPGLDLLAPQHGINAAYSSELSALSALGHPVVHVQASSNISTEELKPFTLVKANGEVKAVNLLPADAIKPHAEFAANLTEQIEILSGVNAVRRGNLEATGKLSGVAYALIDAKFLESVVGLQRSFKSFACRLATAIVQLYQDFAKVEQTIQIAGKANRVYAKQFTGEQIRKVLRVDIEIADPLSRTTSGRMQLADMLLKLTDPTGKPVIKTPEQFLEVLKTGRLEPLTQGQSKELDNIRAENEMLGDGQAPEVFVFDNHPLHIQEHYSVTASPEVRGSGSPVLGAALAHISEHLAQWQGAPLDGLMARGIPPPPAPAPMPMGPPGMAGPPAPGETSSTPPPMPGAPSLTGDQAPAPEGAGPQPNLPNMPINPATGEPAPAPPAM